MKPNQPIKTTCKDFPIRLDPPCDKNIPCCRCSDFSDCNSAQTCPRQFTINFPD